MMLFDRSLALECRIHKVDEQVIGLIFVDFVSRARRRELIAQIDSMGPPPARPQSAEPAPEDCEASPENVASASPEDQSGAPTN